MAETPHRRVRESRFLFEPEDGIYDVILKFKAAHAKNSAYFRSEALDEQAQYELQ